MFNKIINSIIALIVLAVLTSCSALSTPVNQDETSRAEPTDAENYQMLPIISGGVAKLHLDATADGTTQQLAVGEAMAITLESNPSTGYSWVATSSNPEVIAQMGAPEYAIPTVSTTPMVGAPGTETLYFQAVAAGTATITLNYARSWETGVAPDKTLTVTVEVK